MGYYRDDDWHYFAPSVPIEARGGIKAKSKRGGFGDSWWAKRWIEVLESFDIGERLARGRSYARRGQVVSINIENGIVKAQVQGSRSRPYNVLIRILTISKKDWTRIAIELSSQAIFGASLLTGKMPHDIEELFKKSGFSLFPGNIKEMQTECSCPDWSNPCKHIAAVYYLIGEEFDRNPFLIFKLRGMEKDELMSLIEKHTSENGYKKVSGELLFEEHPSRVPISEKQPENSDKLLLKIQARKFWNGEDIEENILSFNGTSSSAALIKRLGDFPFWKGNFSIEAALLPIYHNASKNSLTRLLSS